VTPALLLDTCALLWIVGDQALSDRAAAAIAAAHRTDAAIGISPITAWEVGLLVARGRLALSVAPNAWFQRIVAGPGVTLCALDPDTLIDSSFLPGDPPRDPADRIILATARALALPVVTRDRAILAYAEAGHVAAIPC
jgi:PIN domain nuclease of toxin-antitoxin system